MRFRTSLAVSVVQLEIRSIELDDFVAHLAHGRHGAGKVLGQISPDGVEFQSDGDLRGRGTDRRGRKGQRGRHAEKVAS